MTLIELVRRADKGYTKDFPESSLLGFVDQETGPATARLSRSAGSRKSR